MAGFRAYKSIVFEKNFSDGIYVRLFEKIYKLNGTVKKTNMVYMPGFFGINNQFMHGICFVVYTSSARFLK